jgi:ABC-type uncharacterized transport system permease subunit
MQAFIPGLIAILFYVAGTYLQAQRFSGKPASRQPILWCGWLALFFHFINLLAVMKTPAGYDFGFSRTLILFSWSIVLIVLLSSIRKPLENLFLGLFPLAVLSILLSLSIDSAAQPQQYSAGMAMHILLALLATSIVTIAAVQAGFLYLQNYQLKHHRFALIKALPPLQTMEALLFELVWAGLLMLTGVIVTGILFMEDFLGQHLSHKTAFSIMAWGVFGILLWGRHQMGWRGTTAIRWTLTGFAFLVLAYFGSKFVLEVILHRV